jgi:hypothetical protein
MAFAFDANNNLNVNLAAGSISGGNAAAGPTGSAVPASADYIGVNISGDLVGVTGFSLTNSKAAAIAIVDGSGNQITSFGGGTQYSDGTTQATPTGTVSLGKNASNVLHALSLDASGNLNVNLSANSFGTFTVSGTVAVTQSTSPWVENVSQFGGNNVVTGTGASGVGIPRVTVSNDSVISSITNTVTISGTITANQGTANATPWNENIAQFGGATVSLGSKTSANSIPVVIASDQGNVNVSVQNATLAVTQSTSPWVENVSQFGGSNVVTGTGVSGVGIPRVTVSSDSFPAIQAISATSLPLSTNAAQETGGNLATIASNTRNDSQITDILTVIASQLKLLNYNFAANMPSGYIDMDSTLMDIFPVN